METNNEVKNLEYSAKIVCNNLYKLLESENLSEQQSALISGCIWNLENALYKKSNITVFEEIS